MTSRRPSPGGLPSCRRRDLLVGPLLVALLALLAACGSGTGPTATPGGAGSPGPTSNGTPTEPPAGTPAPPTPGGGTAADVCELVTAAELEQALGVSGVTTNVIAGPPDTCQILADGAPLAAIVYTPSGGRAVFDILAAGSDAQDVAGIGDAAFFSSETGLVAIAKGDAMLSVAVFDAGQTEAARLEAMKQIGTIAAGRL